MLRASRTSRNSFTVLMKLNFHEFSVLHIPMSFNFYFLYDTFPYMNWFPPTFSYQTLYALHVIKNIFLLKKEEKNIFLESETYLRCSIVMSFFSGYVKLVEL